MYAYCENNPICRLGNEGILFETITCLVEEVMDTFIGWASNSVVAAAGISYIYYLTTKKEEKSKVNVKEKAVEKSKKYVIIYR